jgi:PKD repeat protein
VNFDGSNSYDPDGTVVGYAWDFDNDGIIDSSDVITSHVYAPRGDHLALLTVTDNDGLTNTASVEISVAPQPGDFDDDLDVDQEDFGHFQACMTGPGIPVTDADCLDARLDGDCDVDRNDLNIFLGCASGTNVPADPACAG